MCYNIQVLEKKAEKMASRYKALFPQGDLFHAVYHASAFQHPLLPVVTTEFPSTIKLFSWGLIPYWIKSKEEALKIRDMTANCVGETAFSKPSFRHVITKKRCLVPVTGYFEWHTEGRSKYPFYIYLKDKEIFSLAGIFDNWTDKETGEIVDTFSIITTHANPMLEKIHNLKKRMPVILKREDEERWIDPKITKEEVNQLIKPFDESLMTAHSISKLITSRTQSNNVPEVMEPFEYPELKL